MICSGSLIEFKTEICVMFRTAVMLNRAHVHERETVRG